MQSIEIYFHKQFNAFEYNISSYNACETRRGAARGVGENINSITTEILKSFFTI